MIVPLMQKYCSLFSVADTTYKITKEKENSARVVIWREVGVKLSYTLEVGYGGVTMGEFKGQNHTFRSAADIAEGLAKSMGDMIDQAKCKSVVFKDTKPDVGKTNEPGQSPEDPPNSIGTLS